MSEQIARVEIRTLPRPNILDAQGDTVASSLAHLGFSGIKRVRIGKLIELEIDVPQDSAEIIRTLDGLITNVRLGLVNPLTEEHKIQIPETTENQP